MYPLKPDASIPMTPFSDESANVTFSNTRRTAISRRSNALQSVEGAGIESRSRASRTRPLDEFVDEVAVRGRLLQFETERDDVLADRESFPQVASRGPRNSTTGQHSSTFDEPEEA
jgi:hypothetical protein